MAQISFDATTVAPEASRDVLPAGIYLAQVVESDIAPTKTGGKMLKLTHEVIDGACKGRRVWGNINIQNPSPEAERIGQAQLSSLCHAVGVMKLTDSAQLHMKPVRIRVTVTPAGPDKSGIHREARNEVKGYEAGKGAAGAFSAPVPGVAAAAAPAAAQAAPWARKAA